MTRILLLVIAFALFAGGCLAPADPIAEDCGKTDRYLRERGYRVRGRPVRSSVVNRPNQGHNTQCVNVRHWPVTLRYPDFSPTGWVLNRSDAVFGDGRALPRDDDRGRACRDGQIRLDVREIIETPQGRLLFHQGGFGYEGLGDVKYGHVWIGDLADAAPADPGPRGNGAACAPSTSPETRGTYRVHAVPFPTDMRYRKSNYAECRGMADVSACSIGYESYGDPAAQGHAERDPGAPHYTYMVWSWIDVRGGGVVRALVPDGAIFERCNVRSIRSDSIDRSGRVNGWVRAMYGRIRFGDHYVYGWIPHSHRDPSGNYVPHVERIDEAFGPAALCGGDPAPAGAPGDDGRCVVRCCDGSEHDERAAGADDCRAADDVCEDRGKVLWQRYDGTLVYIREASCPG